MCTRLRPGTGRGGRRTDGGRGRTVSRDPDAERVEGVRDGRGSRHGDVRVGPIRAYKKKIKKKKKDFCFGLETDDDAACDPIVFCPTTTTRRHCVFLNHTNYC